METHFVNRNLLKQLINFDGLLDDNKSATDLDAFIEYDNKLFILIECKQVGKNLPYGQRLALERMTDDLEKSGKSAILIVAEHQVFNPEVDIDLKDTTVRQFRFRGEWKYFDKKYRTKDFIKCFIETIVEVKDENKF